jgi:hypothetical protein
MIMIRSVDSLDRHKHNYMCGYFKTVFENVCDCEIFQINAVSTVKILYLGHPTGVLQECLYIANISQSVYYL